MTGLRILWVRLGIILGCVVLATIATFGVTLAWRMYAPRYTAVAYLGVGPPEESAFATSQPVFTEDRLTRLRAEHAEMIKRESVLLRALDTPEVKKTAWYQRDREGSLERLPEILSVTPVAKASLIAIKITEVAPEEQDRIDLAEIANAVGKAYVRDVRAAARDVHAMQIKLHRNKLADLAEMSDSIQMEIKRKRLPEIEFTQQRMKALAVRLEALTVKGSELGLSKNQMEASLKDLEKHAMAGTLPEMAEVRAIVVKEPNIRALRQREQDLHSKRVSLLEEVGPKDASVVAIDTSLAAVRKQLAQAIKEAVPVQAQALKEQLLARLEDITEQLLSVKAQKARIHETVEDLQRNLITMRDLKAREKSIAESVNGIHKTLVQVELRAQTDRPVWLRAKATRPKTVSAPRWHVMMPAGALIGLAVGLAVACSLGLKPKADGPVDSLASP